MKQYNENIRKMSFRKSYHLNGHDYKTGQLSFGRYQLSTVGITEDNPEVYVITDTINNCIIVKSVSASANNPV